MAAIALDHGAGAGGEVAGSPLDLTVGVAFVGPVDMLGLVACLREVEVAGFGVEGELEIVDAYGAISRGGDGTNGELRCTTCWKGYAMGLGIACIVEGGKRMEGAATIIA